VSQTNPATHPTILTVCRRPALLGSGPPPGPPCQDGLDGSCGRWRVGRRSARLARVDGRRDGLPQPPTNPAAPDVARPSRSRRPPPEAQYRYPVTTARRRRTRPAFPARRADSWPHDPADCRPNTHYRPACRSAAALRASRCSRQPPGLLRGRSRSASGATDARPGGGACGPSGAALMDVRKVLPLGWQPSVSGLRTFVTDRYQDLGDTPRERRSDWRAIQSRQVVSGADRRLRSSQRACRLA